MRRIAGTIGWGAFNAICTVIFLLNIFAGIVGGIWLLFKGEWQAVVIGFIASLSMPYWWCIIALPSLGLGMLLVKFGEHYESKIGVAVVAFIAGLYDSFLIMAWIVMIFVWVTVLESEGTLIPMLLWGYSVATSPLIFMASKEPPDSTGSYVMVFMSEIGYILLVILMLFGVPLVYSLIVLAVLGVIKTILLTALAVSMVPSRSRPAGPLTEGWPDGNEWS